MKQALDIFMDSVRSLCPKLTDSELRYLESGITMTTLQAKQFYIQANTIQRDIGFLYQGLIRCYYIDVNGKEITIRFINENQYATHYPAFVNRTPSKYYFQCLEPTKVLNLSHEHIYTGYELHPNFERYGRLIAETVLWYQEKRIDSFLFQSAEERYLNFIEEHPELIHRISLTHLSSYLGIERQSLTRIRKKLSRR